MLEQRNAFEILAEYQKRARRAGVCNHIIDKVIEEAKQGDYDFLVATIKLATLELK